MPTLQQQPPICQWCMEPLRSKYVRRDYIIVNDVHGSPVRVCQDCWTGGEHDAIIDNLGLRHSGAAMASKISTDEEIAALPELPIWAIQLEVYFALWSHRMPTPESSALARQLAALRPLKTRQCARCGATFTTIDRRLYCSDRCKWTAANQRRGRKPRGPIVKHP